LTATYWIAGFLAGFSAVTDSMAESLCQMQEQIVFSCRLGQKQVSVCSSDRLTADQGYLQFRLGDKSAFDLVFPPLQDASLLSRNVLGRSLVFAGGGGGYLRFVDGDDHYIVYTATGRGWGIKDGVAFESKGNLLSHMECQDIPVSQISEDFLQRSGIRMDQNEFEIPGIDDGITERD